MGEELILCTLLCEAKSDRSIQKKSESFDFKQRYELPLSRLSRFGAFEYVELLCKDLFNRIAVTAVIYFDLCLSLDAQAKYSEAFLAGQQYLYMKGEDPYIYVIMGKILCHNLGRFEEAIELLNLALEKCPDYLKGTIFRLLGYSCSGMITVKKTKNNVEKFQEMSVKYMRQALEHNPTDLTIKRALAFVLAESRELEEADALLSEYLETSRSDLNGWHLLCLLKSAQKKYEEALEICQVVLDTETFGLDEVNFFLTQIELYLSLNDTENAQESIEKILKTQRKVSFSAVVEDEFKVQLEPCLDNDIDKSKFEFNSLYEIWIRSCFLFIQLGNASEADLAIEEAVKANGSMTAMLWFLKGITSKLKGEDGMKEFKEAIVCDECFLDTFEELANLALTKNDIEEAFFHAEYILTYDYRCVAAMVIQAKVLRLKGKPTKDLLIKALEYEKTTPIRRFDVIPRAKMLYF